MLAIVIPYYKITFFEATLQSLASQTNQQFKVYIGDDASPENPLLLLEKYKGKFDFVYCRFDNNLGGTSLTQQWERCIALSSNQEWIMILGDDDVLGEDVVDEFYNNLPEIEQVGINVVRFATQVIDGEGQVTSCIYEHPKLEKATDAFWRKFTGKTRSSLSEYLFKRSLFLKFGFREYPLAWHSDDMAWLEFSNGKPIWTINGSKASVRTSTINISGKNDNVVFKDIASIQFLRDLCKLKFIERKKRLRILYCYEVAIKKSRKLRSAEWLFLSEMYIKYMEFIVFGKFIRRLIIAFFT
jgi:GT2 family glycosyltransferase